MVILTNFMTIEKIWNDFEKLEFLILYYFIETFIMFSDENWRHIMGKSFRNTHNIESDSTSKYSIEKNKNKFQ